MQVKIEIVTTLMKNTKQLITAILIRENESDSDSIVLTDLQIGAIEIDHYSNIFYILIIGFHQC